MKFASYGAAGVLTVCLLSDSALANPNGINGHSGKSNVTCTACHMGGAAVPTVEISGPATLVAGETGQYTFIIRGGPAVVGGAGIAVSSSAATLAPAAGSGLRGQSGELTQSAPKAFSNGEVRFDFTMKAPSAAGTVSLFGAGNSANNSGGNTGDGVATTKKDVTITAASSDPQPDETGGCSATGGAPVLMFALAAVGSLLRRRRD